LQLAFGVVLGGIGALVAGRLLSSFLVDTSTTDITTIVAVTLVLSIVAGVAGLAPARRAMRLDPATALRYE
jgi:putative ABC transport system permease protein